MSNDRTNTYCHKSGAQNRKDVKIKVQQNLQGVSKLSSYFSPIVQSVPNPVDDGDGEQVDGTTHSADALETAHTILDPGADFEDEEATTRATITTTQSTTTASTSNLNESVQVQAFNMAMGDLELSNDFSNYLKKKAAKTGSKNAHDAYKRARNYVIN